MRAGPLKTDSLLEITSGLFTYAWCLNRSALGSAFGAGGSGREAWRLVIRTKASGSPPSLLIPGTFRVIRSSPWQPAASLRYIWPHFQSRSLAFWSHAIHAVSPATGSNSQGWIFRVRHIGGLVCLPTSDVTFVFMRKILIKAELTSMTSSKPSLTKYSFRGSNGKLTS